MFNESAFDRHSNVSPGGGGCFLVIFVVVVIGIAVNQARKMEIVTDNVVAVSFADGKAEIVLPGGRYAKDPKWEMLPLAGYLDSFTITLGENDVSLIMRYDLPKERERIEKLLVRVGGPDNIKLAVRKAATEAVESLKDELLKEVPSVNVDEKIAESVTKSVGIEGFAVEARVAQ